MSDPIAVAPPPAPKPTTIKRTRKLAQHGTPEDIVAARKRVQRSRVQRAKKPKKVPRRTLGISLSEPVAEAVELISERYEVAVSAVQRRMIEDGIRRYGTEEEIEHAGLGPQRKQNPFDPMDTQVQETVYDRYVERHSQVRDHSADNYEQEESFPAGTFAPPPMMFTGQSLPTNPGAYEE